MTSVNKEVCKQWKCELQSLVNAYVPNVVFNADETGFFFKCLPDNILIFKNEKKTQEGTTNDSALCEFFGNWKIKSINDWQTKKTSLVRRLQITAFGLWSQNFLKNSLLKQTEKCLMKKEDYCLYRQLYSTWWHISIENFLNSISFTIHNITTLTAGPWDIKKW